MLDSIMLTYVDRQSSSSSEEKKLYFRIKIVWLKRKGLVKILLRDEVQRQSNYTIERMPEDVLRLRTLKEMSEYLK